MVNPQKYTSFSFNIGLKTFHDVLKLADEMRQLIEDGFNVSAAITATYYGEDTVDDAPCTSTFCCKGKENIPPRKEYSGAPSKNYNEDTAEAQFPTSFGYETQKRKTFPAKKSLFEGDDFLALPSRENHGTDYIDLS